MAFTATIQSIDITGDHFMAVILFRDDVALWEFSKTYAFPFNTTQSSAVAQITSDGQSYKNNLAAMTNLRQRVGHVITI